MNLRDKLNELAQKIVKINEGAQDASDAELTIQLEELFYQDLNTFANVLPESIYHAPEHFVNNTKDAIFRYSLLEKRFVFINQAGREITGYSFEELQRSPQSLLELVHPDQREDFLAKWDEMLHGNITYESEYKIICKDKSNRWINLRVFQVFNSINEPVAVEGIVRDITDKKITLEQLKFSEENYRTIFNTIANLIITVDNNGKILECNKQVESCLGYTSDELQGKDFQFLVHSDYQNFAASQHAELLHYGNLLQKEYALQNSSGEKLIVLINAVVLNDSQRIIYSCIDITKRKNTEYKVRAESEVNSLLAKLGREALKTNMSIQNVAKIVHLATLEFTKSAFGVVSFFNLKNEKEVLIVTNEKGTNESVEVDEDKKLTPIFNAIGEIDKPIIINNTDEIRERFPAFNAFQNFICLPIATNDLLVGHIMVANKEEEYNDFDFRVVTQVNDIYSFTLLRKIFEIELVEAKEKAELDDKLKTAFLANMSHEIRTPMNGVLGFTNLLSNSDLSPEMRAQYVGLIESSTKRLLSLLEDILLYSKLESRTVEFKKAKVNFNQVLSILHVDANRKLEMMSGKDVSIKINLELPSNECIMETDAELFQKVFYQLLDNSIKFTDTGSIVF
ncbi:MAG: PAS domain S-box protein [Bacteroidales bacterium]|nr:PAS domain S-box protein [Bacteroidales bacterium]